MNKLKLFVENFLVYGLGGIISKLIPLIMIPIVTRIMPSTDYFGISDLSAISRIQLFHLVVLLLLWECMMRCIVCSLKKMMNTINAKFVQQRWSLH